MLKSEQVIIASPLSVTGGCKRYLRATKTTSTVATLLLAVPRWTVFVLLLGLLLVWNVLVWVFFFWFTLPWRAYRNSRRRDKRNTLQHQELIQSLRK